MIRAMPPLIGIGSPQSSSPGGGGGGGMFSGAFDLAETLVFDIFFLLRSSCALAVDKSNPNAAKIIKYCFMMLFVKN